MTLTKTGRFSEMAKAADSGRTIFVFPDIEVNFNGINMLEWRELVELTLVGKEQGNCPIRSGSIFMIQKVIDCYGQVQFLRRIHDIRSGMSWKLLSINGF